MPEYSQNGGGLSESHSAITHGQSLERIFIDQIFFIGDWQNEEWIYQILNNNPSKIDGDTNGD